MVSSKVEQGFIEPDQFANFRNSCGSGRPLFPGHSEALSDHLEPINVIRILNMVTSKNNLCILLCVCISTVLIINRRLTYASC